MISLEGPHTVEVYEGVPFTDDLNTTVWEFPDQPIVLEGCMVQPGAHEFMGVDADVSRVAYTAWVPPGRNWGHEVRAFKFGLPDFSSLHFGLVIPVQTWPDTVGLGHSVLSLEVFK